MPNDWFQFKQFKIEQDCCAMKVSTDACIQGAWASKWLQLNRPAAGLKILDIGTGTGLLSLMLAQLNPESSIDAVELNNDAFLQAKQNFSSSPWANKLTAHYYSLKDYLVESEHDQENKLYDFIICNPPFFHNHLQAQQKARNDARHSISLSKEELAHAVSLLLDEQGFFCIMYPQTEWNEWLRVGKGQDLYAQLTVEVKPKASMVPNRIIGLFSKKNNQHSKTETLVIYEEDKNYTEQFKALLQPYYLAL
ncbi:MAG: methyltransferase [Taibaiella sp.]|jgi:tRNA1Val (adenine37-N6)-methyltransferase